MKLEDLLGKHVRYKGEEGHVVEGHAGAQASVVVSIRMISDVPRRDVTVPESQWEELELLDWQETPPVAEIARLKVTLKGIRPPIWRRLEVPVEMSLARLSDVILAAFGWTNSHMHEFAVGQRRIGMPDADDWQPPARPPAAALFGRPPLEDEATIDLAAVLVSRLRRLTYTYDFGDNWQHLVQVEEFQHRAASRVYPRCTAGRRSAPPEDCGGVCGYEHLLAVLADHGHEEHAELRAWCPSFDPQEFDLAAADAAVRQPPEDWQ